MADGKNPPLLLLNSPFGDDTLPFETGTLHATGLVANERLSKPFEIELTVVSTDQAIDPNALLYQPVCVTVRRINGIDRFFNGIVRRMEATGLQQRFRWQYRLEVVPESVVSGADDGLPDLPAEDRGRDPAATVLFGTSPTREELPPSWRSRRP